MSTITLGGVERDISGLSYSEIVAIVKERNRPSGGLKTVHEVAINTFLNKEKTLLEIGSNTGFTSVNISLLTGCRVHGIDAIEESVKESRVYAERQSVAGTVEFSVANATALDFKSDTFDAVWCSNVTSFIDDKQKAISEYLRVLKIGGYLIVVPIYYEATPPSDLLEEVSSAVGTKIEVWGKDFWEKLFVETAEKNGVFLERIYESEFRYEDRDAKIESYVDIVLKKEYLLKLTPDQFDALKMKFMYYIRLFNENLKFARYSILIYQKRQMLDEMELFLAKKIYG